MVIVGQQRVYFSVGNNARRVCLTSLASSVARFSLLLVEKQHQAHEAADLIRFDRM